MSGTPFELLQSWKPWKIGGFRWTKEILSFTLQSIIFVLQPSLVRKRDRWTKTPTKTNMEPKFMKVWKMIFRFQAVSFPGCIDKTQKCCPSRSGINLLGPPKLETALVSRIRNGVGFFLKMLILKSDESVVVGKPPLYRSTWIVFYCILFGFLLF